MQEMATIGSAANRGAEKGARTGAATTATASKKQNRRENGALSTAPRDEHRRERGRPQEQEQHRTPPPPTSSKSRALPRDNKDYEQDEEQGKSEPVEDAVGDDGLGAGKASYGDDLETLDKRRTEELKLIGEFDS